MLSIAIRNSVARRVPVAATPMLARGLSNDGSVAQSQGFQSVPPSGSRGLAQLLTLRLQQEGKGS